MWLIYFIHTRSHIKQGKKLYINQNKACKKGTKHCMEMTTDYVSAIQNSTKKSRPASLKIRMYKNTINLTSEEEKI